MATRRSRSHTRAKYLYAIINNGSGRNIPPIPGIMDGTVHLVRRGGLAAVVSDVRGNKVRPQRRNLAAHQLVLNTLLKSGTPLPVAFGIVAEDAAAVKKLLDGHNEMLAAAFARVNGMIEMGLRVAYCVPNIFEYFADIHLPLRQARDRVFGRPAPPSREEKIELGSLFDQLLDSDRERHTEAVEAMLRSCCAEIKRSRCRDEHRVMDLACLVERGGEERFEETVLQAAGDFDNNFTFDMHGPWVPHNFVDLHLEI